MDIYGHPKTWWLELVKRRGSFGRGSLLDACRLKSSELSSVLVSLTNQGLIESYELNVVRRGPKPVRYCLTEEGNRYLQHHQDDLADEPQIGDPRRHLVPA